LLFVKEQINEINKCLLHKWHTMYKRLRLKYKTDIATRTINKYAIKHRSIKNMNIESFKTQVVS